MHHIGHELLDRIGKITDSSNSYERSSATHREPSDESDRGQGASDATSGAHKTKRRCFSAGLCHLRQAFHERAGWSRERFIG